MEQRLLDWATRSLDQDEDRPTESRWREAGERVRSLDPELVEMLLGRDEPAIMRQLASKVGLKAPERDPEALGEEEQALENLEQIVEGLDAANNMQRMGLWPCILKVASDQGRPTRHLALSLMGTAAQNNPETQNALLEQGAIEIVLDALEEKTVSVVLKAVYAASAMVQNNCKSYEAFVKADGMALLKDARRRFPDQATQKVHHILEQLKTQFPASVE